MMKLCMMASHGYPQLLGFDFNQEHGMCRVFKDCQPFLPSLRTRQYIETPSSFSLMRYEVPWSPISNFSKYHNVTKLDSPVKKPNLVDMQVQCAKLERILWFLMAGDDEEKIGKLYFPSLFDSKEFKVSGLNQQQYFPSRVCSSGDLDSVKPLMHTPVPIDRSKVLFNLEREVSIADSVAEVNDSLSILMKFYLSNSSTMQRNQTIVPRLTSISIADPRARIHGSSFEPVAIAATPMKSVEKPKHKQSRRKISNKGVTERNMCKRNYFHACESLLSLMIDKRQAKTSILSLKQSGPRLPELLNQFSASIAGTGIAVVFSVMFKLACRSVPFSASKLFSTGFGFGLVWLSWAVNRLRNTVVCINKLSKKDGFKDEDMMVRVDRCVNEIYCIGATVFAMFMLRFV